MAKKIIDFSTCTQKEYLKALPKVYGRNYATHCRSAAVRAMSPAEFAQHQEDMLRQRQSRLIKS
jgi:hypothetical protein